MVAGIDRASSKLHKQLLGNDRAQHPAGTVRPRVRPASRIRLDYRGGRFFPYIWTPLIKRRARGTNRTRYVKWLNVTHETESSRPIRFYQMRKPFQALPHFFQHTPPNRSHPSVSTVTVLLPQQPIVKQPKL